MLGSFVSSYRKTRNLNEKLISNLNTLIIKLIYVQNSVFNWKFALFISFRVYTSREISLHVLWLNFNYSIWEFSSCLGSRAKVYSWCFLTLIGRTFPSKTISWFSRSKKNPEIVSLDWRYSVVLQIMEPLIIFKLLIAAILLCPTVLDPLRKNYRIDINTQHSNRKSFPLFKNPSAAPIT